MVSHVINDYGLKNPHIKTVKKSTKKMRLLLVNLRRLPPNLFLKAQALSK